MPKAQVVFRAGRLWGLCRYGIPAARGNAMMATPWCCDYDENIEMKIMMNEFISPSRARVLKIEIWIFHFLAFFAQGQDFFFGYIIYRIDKIWNVGEQVCVWHTTIWPVSVCKFLKLHPLTISFNPRSFGKSSSMTITSDDLQVLVDSGMIQFLGDRYGTTLQLLQRCWISPVAACHQPVVTHKWIWNDG